MNKAGEFQQPTFKMCKTHVGILTPEAEILGHNSIVLKRKIAQVKIQEKFWPPFRQGA